MLGVHPTSPAAMQCDYANPEYHLRNAKAFAAGGDGDPIFIELGTYQRAEKPLEVGNQLASYRKQLHRQPGQRQNVLSLLLGPGLAGLLFHTLLRGNALRE
jgi:hypothetical protein